MPLALLLILVLVLAAAYVLAQRAPPLAPQGAPPATGTLRVHYLDVGQGDAVVWELPGGGVALYDCGPPAATAAENRVVQYLRDALGRAPGSRIEALLVSHGHLDHAGGCDEVLAEYDVARIVEPWYEGADAPESYQRFQRAARDEGAQLVTLASGLAPGTDLALPGVRATALWPRAFAPGGWDAVAEASLVVRLEHAGASFCFQGDVETPQERALAAEGAAECDAYLVGHHGSRYASSDAWLAAMDPALAVVSFGDNEYGHPTADALCRVQRAGATVYATHRAGPVVVASGAEGPRVERGAAETKDYCAAGADYWS